MPTPKCGCGCGTELNRRKDKTFANYAPGGHDAKHKSALVKAARDGDKPAMKILVAKGWDKFLKKAPKKTREQVAQRVKKSTVTAPAFYGLSTFDIALLSAPPTETTWWCVDEHAGQGRMMMAGSADECWFCHSRRPGNPELVWPQFLEAMDRFSAVDWEKVSTDARLDERMSVVGMPEIVHNARRMLNLKKARFDPEQDNPQEAAG